MSKIVIIGGGIAGLACAINLYRSGYEVEIYEKSSANRTNGHAFIMLSNGFEAIQRLGLLEEMSMQTHPINQILMRSPDGIKNKMENLQNAIGIRRTTLIEILVKHLPPSIIHYNKAFSHFETNTEGRAMHACFVDGTTVKADIFVGSDGIWSKVRNHVFPYYKMSSVRIRELVSVIKAPEIIAQWRHTFLKTICEKGGMAIGMLPCDEEQLVWFIQYDSQHPQFFGKTLGEQRELLLQKAKKWSSPVPELVNITDFSKSYTWHTTDMETLPRFYKKNVVLVGDAAHVFLTFTSQGLNAALQDALCLSDLIIRNQYLTQWETTFKQYTFMRKQQVDQYLNLGRVLKEQFLHPYQYEEKMAMPLVF